MQITHYQRVYFALAGRSVEAKRANPLILKYREALKELKVKKDSVSASIMTVDDFSIVQKNRDLYEGRYLVRWEIIDNETGWETRMNHSTKALLSTALLAIIFSQDKVEIKTINIKNGSNE